MNRSDLLAFKEVLRALPRTEDTGGVLVDMFSFMVIEQIITDLDKARTDLETLRSDDRLRGTPGYRRVFFGGPVGFGGNKHPLYPDEDRVGKVVTFSIAEEHMQTVGEPDV